MNQSQIIAYWPAAQDYAARLAPHYPGAGEVPLADFTVTPDTWDAETWAVATLAHLLREVQPGSALKDHVLAEMIRGEVRLPMMPKAARDHWARWYEREFCRDAQVSIIQGGALDGCVIPAFPADHLRGVTKAVERFAPMGTFMERGDKAKRAGDIYSLEETPWCMDIVAGFVGDSQYVYRAMKESGLHLAIYDAWEKATVIGVEGYDAFSSVHIGCLTQATSYKGPGGIRDAIATAMQDGRAIIHTGPHGPEFRRMFKRMAAGLPLELEIAADGLVTYIAKVEGRQARLPGEFPDEIQERIDDARREGCIAMSLEYLDEFGVNVRQLRYRAGRSLKVIVDGDALWVVAKSSIDELGRQLAAITYLEDKAGGVVDLAAIFNGYAPPVVTGRMRDEARALGFALEQDGRHLEIVKQEDMAGRGDRTELKRALVDACNRIKESGDPISVFVPAGHQQYARVFISQVFGPGTFATRWADGVLFLSLKPNI